MAATLKTKTNKMKAKYINNRPALLSNPDNIEIEDVIEQNNPPRGVNFWKVLDKIIEGNFLTYKLEMISGSSFTGSVYYQIYEYKTIGKICPVTGWFFKKQTSKI